MTDTGPKQARERVAGMRFALWQNELHQWGFELLTPSLVPRRPGEFISEGRYPLAAGTPGLQITIKELWGDGRDSEQLAGADEEGAYLIGASWHAQFTTGEGMNSEQEAMRLDLDRRKPRDLWVHEHPFGAGNDQRDSRPAVPSPGQWLAEVLSLRLTLVSHDEA